MNLLIQHWSFDPFLVVVLAIVALHEVGLAHLAGRSRPQRNRVRRQRSLLFYSGLLVLIIAVESPIDYWSDDYFWVHMIQHLLLMFAAPMLVVMGAPWLVVLHGLPVNIRRRVGRAVLLGSWSRPLRAAGHALTRPIVAIVAFNVVMVFWHIPAPFDLAERNQFVHIWFMHGSFFVAGVFFWLQFIRSYPFHPALGPVERGGALFATNVVMFVLAMSMSLFATDSWYSAYNHVPGVTLSPLADQQIGAGILWVCGDFWCFPTFIKAVYEFIKTEGGPGIALDRLLRHRTVTTTLLGTGADLETARTIRPVSSQTASSDH